MEERVGDDRAVSSADAASGGAGGSPATADEGECARAASPPRAAAAPAPDAADGDVPGEGAPREAAQDEGVESAARRDVARCSQALYLTREAVEHVLPATLSIDPRMLSAMLDESLWAEWDADGDGRISRADFFEPHRGLLRWLLIHVCKVQDSAQRGDMPDLEVNAEGWFSHRVRKRSFVDRDQDRDAWPMQDAPVEVGLTRGDVLSALLRWGGVSSLNRSMVECLRNWIDARWHEWDVQGRGFVGCADFLGRDGVASAMIEHINLIRVKRAVSTLSESRGQAGKQAEALACLCRFAMGINGEQGPTLASKALEARDMVACATRFQAAAWSEPEQVLFSEGFPLALAALTRHPGHTQVVGWACRLILVQALSLCEAISAVPGVSASWPRLVEAVRSGSLAGDFEARCGLALSAPELAAAVVRAVAALSRSPRGAADPAFLGAVSAASLLLWVLDGSDGELAVLRLLAELPFKRAMPALRGFACATSCLLLCDVGGVMECLQTWGYDCSPFWAPPNTLAANASVGQQVEVCCQGGWLSGTITRAPNAEAGPRAQSRDECWVVACDNDTRVYSRHTWAPGWRDRVARDLDRLRLAVLSRAFCAPRPPRGAAWDAGAGLARRALLNGVIVQGLGPKAVLPPPLPPGPVLRGAPGVAVRVGDTVWLNVPVERARQLQTQRHGDWSEQMAFCLDCPGRAIETLLGPQRVRVSHGGLGTFVWNPAAITRAVSTSEPLPFEEHHGPIIIGDEVLLCASQEHVVPLQVGHGGWSTRMAHCLGRFGRVTAINNRGDVRVDMLGCGAFLWNPAVIEPLGSACVATLCAQAVSRLDDEGAAVLLLLCIAEARTGDVEADAKVVKEVYAALEEAGPFGTVPPSLRAYGALALLAAVLDIRLVLRPPEGSPSARPISAEPPKTPAVRLPECASPELLAVLADTPAWAWPCTDTGGVSFRDVVLGSTDALAAAHQWLLAFFASRHRRLLDPRAAGAPAAGDLERAGCIYWEA